MIKAIIFDFGGVITTRGYLLWMKEEILNFEKNKSFYDKLSDEYDLGKITHKEFTNIIAKDSGVNKEIIWKKIFDKIKLNKDIIKIIKKLKKKYKIVLLTNFHHQPLTSLINKYHLEKYFDFTIVSSLVGMHKPNPKIFKKVFNLLKTKPNEIIFIDDSQKYIDGGKKVGIKSFLFSTNKQLIIDLKNNHINI